MNGAFRLTPLLCGGMLAMALAVPRSGGGADPAFAIEPDGRVLVRWGKGTLLLARDEAQGVARALREVAASPGKEVGVGRFLVASGKERVWLGEVDQSGECRWSSRWRVDQALRVADGIVVLGGSRGLQCGFGPVIGSGESAEYGRPNLDIDSLAH